MMGQLPVSLPTRVLRRMRDLFARLRPCPLDDAVLLLAAFLDACPVGHLPRNLHDECPLTRV
jgi:hypothetical protein